MQVHQAVWQSSRIRGQRKQAAGTQILQADKQMSQADRPTKGRQATAAAGEVVAKAKLLQPWRQLRIVYALAAITIRFTTLSCKIVLRTHPQQRETLTQPFHCDLQRLSCKSINCSSKTGSRKNDHFEALFKRNFKRKIISTKMKKSATKAPFATFMQPLQSDLLHGLAKHNQNRKTVLKNKRPSSSLGAAVPLRSAQTELHNTLELQHATAEHIALMHQFQCTKCLNTCKTQ